jgi:hypothetical protein
MQIRPLVAVAIVLAFCLRAQRPSRDRNRRSGQPRRNWWRQTRSALRLEGSSSPFPPDGRLRVERTWCC